MQKPFFKSRYLLILMAIRIEKMKLDDLNCKNSERYFLYNQQVLYSLLFFGN